MAPANAPEPRVRITRRFTFAASVRLYDPALSEAANAERYGKAARIHGHNYVLDVTVDGPVDASSGMIINLQHLKDLLGERIAARWDHRHLNTDVPELHAAVPTPERIALVLWDDLAPLLPAEVALYRLRLWADEDTYAEVVR